MLPSLLPSPVRGHAFLVQTNQSRVHPPTICFIRFLYSGPLYNCLNDIQVRYQTTSGSSQSLLKLFKLTNNKSIYPAPPVPSCRNNNKGPLPSVPYLFALWATSVLPHVAPLLGTVTKRFSNNNCLLIYWLDLLASLYLIFSVKMLYFKTVKSRLHSVHLTTVEIHKDEIWELWRESF